jgi:hypothetical protein
MNRILSPISLSISPICAVDAVTAMVVTPLSLLIVQLTPMALMVV